MLSGERARVLRKDPKAKDESRILDKISEKYLLHEIGRVVDSQQVHLNKLICV